VVAESLLPVDGFLPIRKVEPDPHLLDEVHADADTSRRWHDRLWAVS
jgi:o-succinylbenzoate synthase